MFCNPVLFLVYKSAEEESRTGITQVGWLDSTCSANHPDYIGSSLTSFLMDADAPSGVDVRTGWVLGTARILLGWIFLWGFLDKLLGLGFATSTSHAWINGGSPTQGFLSFGVSGIFQSFYHSLAGNAVVDWLFMLALLALGIALILGIGMRLAAYGGTVFLLLLWGANVPPAQNPFIDEHIIYILLLWILFMLKAGQYIGLGSRWARTGLVRRWPLFA
ncbi:MAG: hypothetical protein ABR879_04820 [Methanomassiliicoccales archaeon]